MHVHCSVCLGLNVKRPFTLHLLSLLHKLQWKHPLQFLVARLLEEKQLQRRVWWKLSWDTTCRRCWWTCQVGRQWWWKGGYATRSRPESLHQTWSRPFKFTVQYQDLCPRCYNKFIGQAEDWLDSPILAIRSAIPLLFQSNALPIVASPHRLTILLHHHWSW